MRQLVNCLSRGPEAIRFNHEDVCGSIVVLMQEPYARQLGLLYDSTKVVSADNCRFWEDFDPEKNFPGEGELYMTTFSCAFPFGQGAVVPQSFDELLNSIESVDNKQPILNGKPAPGVADALRALKNYDFNSSKNMFHKEQFKKIVAKPPFFTNMLVEEKNRTSTSPNGLQHSNIFIDKLNQAIRYARIVCPSK